MDQISTYVMAPAPGEEPLVDDSGPNLFSAASVPAPPSLPPDEVQAIMATIMEDITAERDCTYQPISSLFQDFTTRCRMKKIGQHVGDATQFRRRFALAVAGIYRPTDEEWAPLLQLSRSVPDDLLTPFLVIARAAWMRRRARMMKHWRAPMAPVRPVVSGDCWSIWRSRT
jgi:hypothetical protein